MQKNLYIGCNGRVAAIDPLSGREIWRTKLSSGILSATAAQDVSLIDYNGKIYAGCHGHLYCLEESSGTILWHNELEGMGYNDVTMSIDGRSVHSLNKTHHHHS